jgi:hypothetical protein
VSAYSRNERLIAKFLEQFPLLRAIAKYFYQRIVYLQNYSSIKIKIKDGWVLEDPFQDIKGETFFGYYDKSSFNLNGDLLTHAVIDGSCYIYVKLASGELLKIAKTKAWNWQQGSMATWLDNDFIGFNDIFNGLVTFCIFSIKKGCVIKKHSNALQSYSLTNRIYASISYEKLNLLRPEYGYCKLVNNDFDINYGIKISDIETGESIYRINLDKVIKLIGENDNKTKVKINHCLFSPNGESLLFMYRAFRKDGKYSYLLLWDYKKDLLTKLMGDRIVSHYSWINDKKIVVWGRIENQTGYHFLNLNKKTVFNNFKHPLLLGDGHPSYCIKGNTILTDTYPDKSRVSSLFLINNDIESQVLQLKQPWKYKNSRRIDLHPRFNQKCELITLESGHSGNRRQYVLKKLD